MESRGDSWESEGWDSGWQQSDADLERDQVLELARRLAEQHRRQSADALVEVEDLKRALRERAADVARRELEVERRTKELEEHTHSESRRTLRLRRSEPGPSHDEDRAYAEELLSRREAEVQQRLAALAPREREVGERETALRARELELEEAKAALDRRKQEVESSHARLREREHELAAERNRLEEEIRSAEPRPARGAHDELALQTGDLVRRARELDELERQLTAREAELAAAATQRDTDDQARRLAALESSVRAREGELIGREAELLRLQAGLAAQQESIRARERALEDAERLRQREAVRPAHPYVSFSEGLDAFTGGRPRPS